MYLALYKLSITLLIYLKYNLATIATILITKSKIVKRLSASVLTITLKTNISFKLIPTIFYFILIFTK